MKVINPEHSCIKEVSIYEADKLKEYGWEPYCDAPVQAETENGRRNSQEHKTSKKRGVKNGKDNT